MAVTFKKISLRVLIAGGEVRNVVGVDVSMGVSQINAQAQIHLTSRPGSAVEGAICEVWAGFDGHTDQIFKGELDGTEWSYFPGEITLPARDKLARLRYEWGGDDREYTEQDDAEIIRNLLEAMGIPSSQAHIESSAWELGIIEPVIAPQGRAFWPLIEEIDQLAGYRTYTDRAGVIRRYQVSGNIGVGSEFQLAEGDNIVRIRRRRSLDGIINKAVVTGIDYEGLTVGGPGVAEAQAANPFVPNPPEYITQAIQSNLIEDDDRALAIAIRTVKDKNRRPETFEIETIGLPRIQPLSIIAIQHSEVEVASGKVIVDRVQHSIRGASFKTTITTLGGTVDATAQNIPPIAAFDLKLFREAEDTGSGVSAIVVGVADGSASSDPDGALDDLTFEWAAEVDAGTVDPTSGSDPLFRFVIEGAATTLTITLTVTDTGGAENVLERIVPLTSSSLLIEPLYTGEDGIIAASADGEQTWSEFTVSGDAYTPPFAAEWGTIWGAGDGHIWASIDKLASPAVDLGAPHGAVACTAVWINEIDTTRLWAGFADGAVYSGTIDPIAVTATWIAAGEVPDSPIVEIRESVGALGDLRATAGAGYYHSGDGGASWELLFAFDDLAWRMAAGFEHNLASGLNSDPPLFDEAGAAPSVPGGVTHIRGLTFGWQQQILYATDDAAQLYTTDDTLAALTLHTDALPAQGNQMIRSGNVDGIVYAACGDGTGSNNGAVKWYPDTKAPWYIRKTGARRVNTIGYGPAQVPTAPVAILLLPFGASGAGDFIWRYTPGIGWEGIAPPQSGWYWHGIAANPFDRNKLLLWGNNTFELTGQYTVAGGELRAQNGVDSPFYRSDDGGATWQEIALGTGTRTNAADRFLACWSESDPNLWCATTVLDHPFNLEGMTIAFWRNGTGATSVPVTGGLTPTATGQIIGGLTSGTDGEFIWGATSGGGSVHQVLYVARGGTTAADPTGPGYMPLSSLPTMVDRLPPLSRNVIVLGGVLSSDDLNYASDYHFVPAITTSIADAGVQVTAAADAVYVGGRLNGILRVINVDNNIAAASGEVVAGTGGIQVGHIRSGRAQRLAVACRKTGSIDCFVKGAVGGWSTLAGPPAATTLADYVEVIDSPEVTP